MGLKMEKFKAGVNRFGKESVTNLKPMPSKQCIVDLEITDHYIDNKSSIKGKIKNLLGGKNERKFE